MTGAPITRVVIVGGGTAGWMTATALKQRFGNLVKIDLIESEAIGTVGVGEATLPPLRQFNHSIGLSDPDFIRETNATFKLGIEFCDWGWEGNRFFHAFGNFGPRIEAVTRYQYWLRLRQKGDKIGLAELCLPSVMAERGRFAQPAADPNSPFSEFGYAFHIDATAYARLLRSIAERRGVKRTNAKVTDVSLRGEDGFIEALVLEDGTRVEGDLFIDCSGFGGLLIEKALQTGYEDWSHWLPCNRAVTVGCENPAGLTPYTRSTAREAGWQWRIPLQHRIGNGHVYASAFTSDDAAAKTLMDSLDGAPVGEPRILKFTTGRRKKFWNKNCVAIGLSAGFLEPLESTSIALIQTAVSRLIEFFPDLDFRPMLETEFNRLSVLEHEHTRDFVIQHYALTQRRNSELWRHVAEMPLPDTLQYKIDLFRACGRPLIHPGDTFLAPSWITIYNGHDVVPEQYDARVERMTPGRIRQTLREWRILVDREVAKMPTHEEFMSRNFGWTASH